MEKNIDCWKRWPRRTLYDASTANEVNDLHIPTDPAIHFFARAISRENLIEVLEVWNELIYKYEQKIFGELLRAWLNYDEKTICKIKETVQLVIMELEARANEGEIDNEAVTAFKGFYYMIYGYDDAVSIGFDCDDDETEEHEIDEVMKHLEK